MPESVVRGQCDQSVSMSAKPNTSLNERTKHSSSTFMVSVRVPSMSNMTRCTGKRPNGGELSHAGPRDVNREAELESLPGVGCSAIPCENSFSDHPIHLLDSSKLPIP